MRYILKLYFSVLFALLLICSTLLAVDSESFDEGELIPIKQNYTTNLSEVVSVCCSKDALTWQKASEQIVKNISANQYKVIVPDIEVDQFKSISNKKFKVIPESEYMPGAKNLLERYVHAIS